MNAGIRTPASDNGTLALFLSFLDTLMELALVLTRPLPAIDSGAVLGWDMTDVVILGHGFFVAGTLLLAVEIRTVRDVVVHGSLCYGTGVNSRIDGEGCGLGVDGICIYVGGSSLERIDPSEWE